jgi:hypothetical protein
VKKADQKTDVKVANQKNELEDAPSMAVAGEDAPESTRPIKDPELSPKTPRLPRSMMNNIKVDIIDDRSEVLLTTSLR